MYLSELNLWNFRKYGTRTDETGSNLPGISLSLNPQLNLLVGENDAGKTALISAIKLVLNTHSNEFSRPQVEDFYIEPEKEERERSTEFKIECIFKGFSKEEAKNFLEWLSFYEDEDKNIYYYLKIFLVAKRDGKSVFYDLKAGSHVEGSQIDGKARELLRTTFLKPLRDSESELSPRRNSRLSQILYNHDAFSNEESHELLNIIQEANKSIGNYFRGVDLNGSPIEDSSGKELLEELNSYLNSFSREGNLLKSNFSIADTKLKSILERLSLQLFNNKAGLGSQNLLFIATELLLLKRDNFTGLKLALIEEIEAHLHPQSQTLLIEYLEEVCNDSQIQMILTTHSPILASKVNIESINICKNNGVFNMSSDFTELRKGDYSFLQRFLDVTRSNLFFANGIIMVEGDAENILIPTIAKIMGIPLSKYGISVINVGSTGFLRYSNIFNRKNVQESLGVSVACITDVDVKPFGTKYTLADKEVSYEEYKIIEKTRKEKLYTKQDVKCFVSDSWTLEFCIAASELKEHFFKAVKYAEYIENSEVIGLTDKKIEKGNAFVLDELTKWETENKTNEEIAYLIYNDYMLAKKISKAIVAQCFANILCELKEKEIREILKRDSNLKYLVDAIKYAAKLGDGS
ncbi:ATP-dependent endonuclease [Peribacillus butanolivorans]|uniref:ATP-dependent nuclease n=1 Tax=Peribacillus butanolivorans TaxID=421767 RepID=UPI00369DC58A